MAKRLSLARRNEIKAQAQAWKREDHPVPETERRVMRCGHEDDIPPGVDGSKTDCAQCIAESRKA